MIGKLIAFRLLKQAGQRRTNQFCKKFYGQDTSTGGRKYRRVGLMDGIPYKKLIRGVIIMSVEDAPEVIGFLKEFNAEFHVRDVMLTQSDKEALRRK
jgi:hypothetical protein